MQSHIALIPPFTLVVPPTFRAKFRSTWSPFRSARTMERSTLLLLLAAICCQRSLSFAEEPPCGMSLILLGSTGDLAKRYIWPAIFDNYIKKKTTLEECSLVLFGASRKPVASEDELWSEVTIGIECPEISSGIVCQQQLEDFRKTTKFVQLNTEQHYQKLSESISEVYREKNLREIGRIFYLSVPPSAYGEISGYIHQSARPPSGWLRIVLEKPFGHDLPSATILAESLSTHLSEDEIYRVDHYLGKLGVQQILPFRQRNEGLLSSLWNKGHIDHVEIVMKERLDVQGRLGFYDSYGVIRDVLQNHLTEVLVRLIMDLSCVSTDSLSVKRELLSRVYSPGIRHAILGQYSSYQQHLSEDGILQNPGNASKTPTYASVVLYLRDPKWNLVPFILTSGKELNERSAYAKVVFKDRTFSLIQEKRDCPTEIIFLIQDEVLNKPGILISSHFSDVIPPFPLWIEDTISYPECQYRFIHPQTPGSSNAYVSLLDAVLSGRKDLFVDTYSLLESWRIWTPILDEIQNLKPTIRLYSPDILEILDFELKGTRLVETRNPAFIVERPPSKKLKSLFDSQLTNIFRVHTHVGHQLELVSLLANHVYTVALDSVRARGSFHMALPGGKSPLLFLQVLVLEYQQSFPWHATHVWQTDERCVRQNTSYSNLHQLSEHLLTMVPIPYSHVHPMPVELQGGICAEDDNNEMIYERQLLDHTGKMDYVLLGVGRDGHTASLFPNEKTRSDKLVERVTLERSYPNVRMTLSYTAILQARHVGLLMFGKEKTNIFQKLKQCFTLASHCDVPVIKLMKSAQKEQVVLYIDTSVL